ncbi:hypothetical protein F5Y16DRAFT_135350 [Xylariaceae sp. FL0255]|nr:hypothetical protein F5Y16DRAFT_135350 [Xylariaceae sp. FL0255]
MQDGPLSAQVAEPEDQMKIAALITLTETSSIENNSSLTSPASTVPSSPSEASSDESGPSEKKQMDTSSVKTVHIKDTEGEQSQVKYRWEDAGPDGSVLLIIPTTEQLADLQNEKSSDRPIILRAAQELGAANHGVFKISVPEQARIALPDQKVELKTSRLGCTHVRRCAPQECSVYKPVRLSEGFWRLDPEASRRSFCRPPGQKYEPVRDMERLLRDCQDIPLEGVRYLTDVPAWTKEQRINAGLPISSLLTTLAGDGLRETRQRLGGVHSPTKFEGPPGAPFCWHVENCKMWAFNYCWLGERTWNVIPPGSSSDAENVFRTLPLSNSAQSKCAAFMMHNAIFGTVGFEGKGVPIRSFQQLEGEIVVTFPNSYHSGHAVRYSVVDARNYFDGKLNVEQHTLCGTDCPEYSIRYEHIRPLKRGEKQLGEDDRKEPAENEDEVDKPVSRDKTAANVSRKRPRSGSDTGARKQQKPQTIQPSSSVPELTQKIIQIRSVEKLCSIPAYRPARPPSPDILFLASALRSREAIDQFRSLVASRRAPDNKFRPYSDRNSV